MNDLSENSLAYYEKSDVYKLFSDAEDFLDLAFSQIKHNFLNQTVLDLGCGNSKYLKKILPLASCAIGVDKSFFQLSQNSDNSIPKIQANASILPFKNETFDILFSSWVLGTILDLNLRAKVLNEALRVLKPNGKYYLFENAENSHFEVIRGRHSNDDFFKRTQKYNQWLVYSGFKLLVEVSSSFSFASSQEAEFVFKSIWGDNIKYPVEKTINHEILIFEYTKK